MTREDVLKGCPRVSHPRFTRGAWAAGSLGWPKMGLWNHIRALQKCGTFLHRLIAPLAQASRRRRCLWTCSSAAINRRRKHAAMIYRWEYSCICRQLDTIATPCLGGIERPVCRIQQRGEIKTRIV